MAEKEFYPLMHPRMFPIFAHEFPDMLGEMLHLLFPGVEIRKLTVLPSVWNYFSIQTEQDEKPVYPETSEPEYLIDDIHVQPDGTIEVRLMRYPQTDQACAEEDRETESILCQFFKVPFSGSGNALCRYEVVDVLDGNRRFAYSPRILAISLNGNDQMLDSEQKSLLKYLREGRIRTDSSRFVKKLHGILTMLNCDCGWCAFIEFIDSIQGDETDAQ